MRKMVTAVLGAALLGGCAMKEFSSTPFYSGNEVKFTGAVEDRVNLWPLAYWREPVGSVAWPVVSWGDDHLAFRPLYSQYKQRGSGDYDEFNFLWPISQFDTKHRDYRVFPLFWGKSHSDKPYFCLFPALWWNREFAGVFPIFWDNDSSGSGFCVFPLLWSETTPSGSRWNTLWPLYYYESYPRSDKNYPSDSSEFWALCYLVGYNRRDGNFTDHRFLPFYVWDRGDFYSLPYSRYNSDELVKSRVLCGLAGGNSNTDGGYKASWLFPLYYHDKARFVTPFFGKAGESYWLLPLYYHDKDVFVTPFYGRCDDAEWLIPLFYRDDESFVTPLYGRNKKDGSDWLLPLYYRDEDSFLTIPFGYQEQGSYTNTYFAAGLAGLKSGKTEGGWIFPIYEKETDADYCSKAVWMDVEKLPDDMIWTETRTNRVWNSSREAYDKTVVQELQATEVWLKDERTTFLVSDNDRRLCGRLPYGVTNRYEMTERHKLGNMLVFNHESKRKVCFDTVTREKISDSEDGDTSLLMLLYNGEHRSNKAKGTSYTSHRVLWKLWDWEEENGDVALDVFPGFTYDSKKNGYCKTSLLWRFFRYENDPEKGKKVDLLFIPVWR